MSDQEQPADSWDGRQSDHIRPRGFTDPAGTPRATPAVTFPSGARVSARGVDGATQYGTVHPTVVLGAPSVPVVWDGLPFPDFWPARLLTVAEDVAA